MLTINELLKEKGWIVEDMKVQMVGDLMLKTYTLGKKENRFIKVD